MCTHRIAKLEMPWASTLGEIGFWPCSKTQLRTPRGPHPTGIDGKCGDHFLQANFSVLISVSGVSRFTGAIGTLHRTARLPSKIQTSWVDVPLGQISRKRRQLVVL